MKKIASLDEIKGIELGILISFDKFCRENDIKYSLGAGTMIGAVRHRGFIPWDDDVDIFMLRKEYDKFLELVKQNNFTLDEIFYHVLNPENEKNVYPFIKIVDSRTIAYERDRKKKYMNGIWMDIFPIDCCGDTDKEVLEVIKYMKKNTIKLERTMMHYSDDTVLGKIKNIYLFFMQNVMRCKYEKYKNRVITFKFPSNGKYYGTVSWPYYKGNGLCDVYPKEYFEGYTEKEFEGHKFMVFKHYDEILSHRYGDYMQLPDEKDRVNHGMEAYLLEEEVR